MAGAIGIVYGDIGTSPLYAMKEAFSGTHALSPEPQNILGFLSLVFWALTIVVSVKYVLFMMRADNKGEGGIMALIALTQRVGKANSRLRWLLSSLGLFGAALFYGDGMITPAISVLSAVDRYDASTGILGHSCCCHYFGTVVSVSTTRHRWGREIVWSSHGSLVFGFGVVRSSQHHSVSGYTPSDKPHLWP